MGCKDCGQSAGALPVGNCRTFTCPLDGAEVEIVVRGVITATNLTLVKQYMSLVYEAIETFAETPEKGTLHAP